jgi:NAD+ kinase
MEVYIDGSYVLDQRADGIIIATPTGSTAHSLSAGGPVVHPSINAILLVPICSHSLNSRPLIFSNESTVVISIKEFNHPEPTLSLDGQTKGYLMGGDRIRFKKYKKMITVLHSRSYDYFHSLRSKLNWGRMI